MAYPESTASTMLNPEDPTIEMHKTLDIISPIGKMSLSNYIIQSIIGASIYYGFGLKFYEKTGATYSMLVGLSLSVIYYGIYLITVQAAINLFFSTFVSDTL